MEMGEILGLISVVVSSVIGPVIVMKQKAGERRASQMADAHVASSAALSKLVGAVESLSGKMDAIQVTTCNASPMLSQEIMLILHSLQNDMAVIKDRGQR